MMDSSEKPKSTPRRLRWRTLFKLALLVMAVLILIPVLQILVPAVAYYDDLAALLNYSEDCQAPCFTGVTPGKSTLEELENHPWVAEVITTVDPGMMVILWSEEKPEFGYCAVYIDPETHIIRRIYLQTKLPFTSAIAMFGVPEYRDFEVRYEWDNATGHTVVESLPPPNSIRFKSFPSIFDYLKDNVALGFSDGT